MPCSLIIIQSLVDRAPGNLQEGKLRHKVTHGGLHEKAAASCGEHSAPDVVSVKLSQIP